MTNTPYGLTDLHTKVEIHPQRATHARCLVRGCTHWLRFQQRTRLGEACPLHGIRIHKSQTYSYNAITKNMIVGQDFFQHRVDRHPFKVDTTKMANENSEDALSWNVFCTLQQARLLGRLIKHWLGISSPMEPQLFLWGLQICDQSADPWELLIKARQRFESNLPVDRPLTEPDIAIHLPGRYLVLIEAKFTSPNTYYERGPRKDSKSLTHAELRSIYQDRDNQILDDERAAQQPRLFYQLWRNMTFAEWMARYDHPTTEAFHINLVRRGYEQDSATEFARLVRPEYRHRFQQRHWEEIAQWLEQEHAEPARRCLSYLRNKTTCLKPAFDLAR